MKPILILTFLASTLAVQCQATPDCEVHFRFSNIPGEVTNGVTVMTAPGASPAQNNIIGGCTAWTMNYSSEGLTGLTVALQSAPNVANPAAPGTFVSFVGTTVTGTNPSSALSAGSYSATGFQPWLRVNLATATGTGSVNVTLIGWKATSPISSSSGGSIPSITTAGIVTATSGGVLSTIATVPNSDLSNMLPGTIKSNLTGIAAPPSDNTLAAVQQATTLSWVASVPYVAGSVATVGNAIYRNLTGSNTATSPATDTTNWASVTAPATYSSVATGTMPTGTTQTIGSGASITTSGTGFINLNGSTSPLELNGSAGTVGQYAISSGVGATPVWAGTAVGTFAASATTGTIAHNLGSIAHNVSCWDTANYAVQPSQITRGTVSDTLTFPGGLVNATTCVAR